MNQAIRAILEKAIYAPSGDNCQPWNFVIKNDCDVYLYNDPNADKSEYNINELGSYISHGAVIENIIISASHEGLRAHISLFPEKSDQNLIAIIKLTEEAVIKKDPLYESITKRVTNRKMYKSIPISASQIKELSQSGEGFGEGTIKLIDNKDTINHVSTFLSVNEKILFENRRLHDFFFSHIRWTKEENEKYRNGFDIKTLELEPKQEKGMKIFKSWTVQKICNILFKISKVIAGDNAKRYASASILGAIVVKDNKPENYIAAGRIMQRIWLKATSLGLSLQPITGVLFLKQRILAGQAHAFSKQQIHLINEAFLQIAKVFKVDDTIAMHFRIGHADAPSAKSIRKNLESFLIT